MSQYQHQFVSNQPVHFPAGKAVCVGSNYHDHIKEMNSVVNNDAVLFMKPATAFAPMSGKISIPTDQGECHNEAELVILISKPLTKATEQDAANAIAGIGIGLDLTLREVQQQLKKLGRPWERAKAFDGSAVISPFVEVEKFDDFTNINFSLSVNTIERQQGNSQQMIRAIVPLLSLISQNFTLLPGDVVFTGTPAGVGPLKSNDTLLLTLEQYQFNCTVA